MVAPPPENGGLRLAALGDPHCTRNSQGALLPLLRDISAHADVLLLCGDLTGHGQPEEARVFARELSMAIDVPMVAVLGNHDYELGKEGERLPPHGKPDAGGDHPLGRLVPLNRNLPGSGYIRAWSMRRIFLLSPADCGGERARMVLNPLAEFRLAAELRRRPGAPLGELFTFLSGLYFRGKLEYARAFTRPPADAPGVLVITPSRGLRPVEERVTTLHLRAFQRVPVHEEEPRYRRPLLRDARRLAAAIGPECQVVLLGSLATGKYLQPLASVFAERLCFPAEFVGMGDMKRGAILLRSARSGRELEYRSLSEEGPASGRTRGLAQLS